MSIPELASTEWAARLSARFFRREYGGVYVLFYVDRPSLAELADAGEEEAVGSLVASLVPQLRRREPKRLFEPLLKQTVRWKVAGGAGPPPCLPALGLAVLAATEMRREGGRSSTNYHAWFLELMQLSLPDLEGDSLWHAYADAYPQLWENLRWWLDECHGGELGLSTISEDPRNTKLGFADSQTIFMSSDREKLSQFFEWIRLRPGAEMPSEELLQYFRIWAARRGDLSPGAELMVLEEGPAQLQLGQLIAEAASRWEGGVRDDQGRLEGRISLTLTRPPGVSLGLAAPCPPGFPRVLEPEGLDRPLRLEAEGFELPLADDEQRWYGSLDLPVTDRALGDGLRLESGGYALRLPPYWFHVFHMSPELGCWASVEQLRPSQPAWILVLGSRLDDVRQLLGRRARQDWRVVEREGIAPKGWALIRDVIIDPGETAEDEELRRLVPRASNRLVLGGGLPLPRGSQVYLSGGDPDVMLPPLSEDAPQLPIELDGAEISAEPGANLVSLVDLAPSEGSHVVRIGLIRRRYSTIRTLGSVLPRPETPVGHELRGSGGHLSPTSLDASSDPALPDDGARVLGSLVELGSSLAVESPRSPLVLPRGAQRRVLIAGRPGPIEEVGVPAEPLWMRIAGLQCQSFEHSPSIDAEWLVTEWRSTGPRVRRVEPTGTGGGNGARDGQRAWAEVVLACGLDCADPDDQEAWATLRALAAEIG
jgi:hypothetical protein